MVKQVPSFAARLIVLVLASSPATAAATAGDPVHAPHPASLDSRDPATVPVLASLLKDGYPPRYLHFEDRIGLDVWFVQMPDHTPRVIYTLPNGSALFGGQVYVASSAKDPLTSLTNQHLIEATAVLADEHVTPIPPGAAPETSTAALGVGTARLPAASTLIAAFDAVHGIEAGLASAPLISVVVDPDCPYCREFWKAIRPAVRDGRVRVRLILTTPLGANSLSSATAILAAPDALAAWDAHADGRPLPAPKADADLPTIRKRLAENDQMRLSVLNPAGLTGVPFLLYRNAQGKLGYSRGIASADVPALVASVSALPPPSKP